LVRWGALRPSHALGGIATIGQAQESKPASFVPSATLDSLELLSLKHSVFSPRDGAPGGIRALAQTPDGILWVGTAVGLFRYDGARFDMSVADRLPSPSVSSLWAEPGGELWIGYTFGGVSLLRDGKLTNFDKHQLPAGTVKQFFRSSDGILRVATSSGLAKLTGSRWTAVGAADGYPAGGPDWMGEANGKPLVPVCVCVSRRRLDCPELFYPRGPGAKSLSFAAAGTSRRQRERIARDIHDTLLQGIQALLLRLQIWELHPCISEPLRQEISKMISQASAIVVEGRERVLMLRRTQAKPSELRQALLAIATEESGDAPPAVSIHLTGAPAALTTDAFEQLVDIAREAIRNAYLHARAKHITLTLSYRRLSFSLTVSDDGKGIDAATLQASGATGHFGLIGMSERARQLHAQFRIEKNEPSGTRITVVVPARTAYRKIRNWPWRAANAALDKVAPTFE
jgi:signal transduction histidine kinase